MMSTQHPLQTTPPGSFTSVPPTPPTTGEKPATSISSIIAEIKRRSDGNRLFGEPWLRFRLDEHQYRDLQSQLKKVSLWSYFKDTLRHDYFPSLELFVLRMPGLLHESLQSCITQEILRQLRTIAESEGPAAEFANNIDNNASAEISFTDAEYGSHQPDASFQHLRVDVPGVVLEVSHSQKKKDLPRLADEYILGSDAKIRVVIGIDIEYKGSKKASVSIWRPHIGPNDVGELELSAMQTVTDQLFRDDVGKLVPNPQACVQLRLEDFTTETFAATFTDLTQTITISSEKLFELLERSEVKVRVKQDEGVATATNPWVRKRRRKSTPPQEIDPDRERKFQALEKRAAEQAMRDDGSYKASSSEAEAE